MMNKPVTIGDFSAVVTGMLLAYNLPPGSPWWLAVIGSAIAIALVKHVFGGLGHNFMNPALAARAILLACWPVRMTSWIQPGTDAVSTSTPLALLKASDAVSSATSQCQPQLLYCRAPCFLLGCFHWKYSRNNRRSFFSSSFTRCSLSIDSRRHQLEDTIFLYCFYLCPHLSFEWNGFISGILSNFHWGADSWGFLYGNGLCFLPPLLPLGQSYIWSWMRHTDGGDT
jgi:hypothetical protein